MIQERIENGKRWKNRVKRKYGNPQSEKKTWKPASCFKFAKSEIKGAFSARLDEVEKKNSKICL